MNSNNNNQIRKRFEEYIEEKSKKRFSNIDDAVVLIQKNVRKYLDKINNTNSNLMKLINQRKKNILEKYNNDKELLLDITPNKNKNNNKKLNEEIAKDLNLNLDDFDNNKIKYSNNSNEKIDKNENENRSVFEKIYKNMKNKESKFELSDESIERNDNLINNQLDMIKNIQKRQFENLNINIKDNNLNKNNNIEDNNEKNKVNDKNIIIDNSEISKDINKINEEADDLIENDEKIDYTENNKINENNNINENNIKDNNINNSELKENKEEEKNEMIKENEINNINNNPQKEEGKNELSPSKNEIFKRLANFLDSTVENPEKSAFPINNEKNINNNISNNIILKEELASSKNINNDNNNYISLIHDNTEKIGLNLELKECKKTIETMSSVINDLRIQLKSKDDFLNKALLSQKKESDLLLQRQNTLMESLISEKRNMEIQITDLQSKLNESEKINYKKLQKMRDNYELESKKNKEAWFQAEKIRRKKWEENKIKEIKELTAKGLEPEVEKIISNHKNEINTLEEKYLYEMKNMKEKIIEEYEIKFNELKNKYIRERDEAIEGERNIAANKLRNQSERLEDEITEERRRWNAKLNSEIERLENLREKDKKIYEEQIIKLEERNKKNIFSNENFYQKKYDDIKNEYENKLKMEIYNSKKI